MMLNRKEVIEFLNYRNNGRTIKTKNCYWGNIIMFSMPIIGIVLFMFVWVTFKIMGELI